MFSPEEQEKIIAEAERLEAAGDVDGARKLLADAMADLKAEGHTIPASQLQAVADYVTKAVQIALAEILETAEAMDSKVIPVEFVQYVMGETPTAVTQLWRTVESLGAPVDFGIPDDISELDGL